MNIQIEDTFPCILEADANASIHSHCLTFFHKFYNIQLSHRSFVQHIGVLLEKLDPKGRYALPDMQCLTAVASGVPLVTHGCSSQFVIVLKSAQEVLMFKSRPRFSLNDVYTRLNICIKVCLAPNIQPAAPMPMLPAHANTENASEEDSEEEGDAPAREFKRRRLGGILEKFNFQSNLVLLQKE